MFGKILFTIACVVLPVAWGVVVNWIFQFWAERSDNDREDESIFPDFQI